MLCGRSLFDDATARTVFNVIRSMLKAEERQCSKVQQIARIEPCSLSLGATVAAETGIMSKSYFCLLCCLKINKRTQILFSN